MKVNPRWRAIAAMSENRVIGKEGGLPWHLPEDFRWFKQTTFGHAMVMGRRTFESLPGVLPGRRHIVMSRNPAKMDVETVTSVKALEALPMETDLFIIGGAEVFALLLPKCCELYLSLVKRQCEGDVFFPEFESMFVREEIIADHGEFEILRYVNRG